jgi:16S rRNA (guanine527-N7)-methyltransferase
LFIRLLPLIGNKHVFEYAIFAGTKVRMKADIIFKYFPNLSEVQKFQFIQLENLYKDWNLKINVVSRKDIEELYLRHVLHSIGIAMVQEFKPKSNILDVGTGGGFPGIPLAILFPETKFTLVDSHQSIAGLKN